MKVISLSPACGKTLWYVYWKRFRLPKGSSVLSDEMVSSVRPKIVLKTFFALSKYLIRKRNELHLLTNRFDLSADEIAEFYKSRWAIELFFKWMKQHLNIKKFYGYSEQAIHNQVYIAMIVYCLNVLAQLNTQSKRTYLQISRYLKAALWKPLKNLVAQNHRKAVP